MPVWYVPCIQGALLCLAAATVGLGEPNEKYLRQIVPPVLASFTDQDSRVRYYACEALYNIAKVSAVDPAIAGTVRRVGCGVHDEHAPATIAIAAQTLISLAATSISACLLRSVAANCIQR